MNPFEIPFSLSTRLSISQSTQIWRHKIQTWNKKKSADCQSLDESINKKLKTKTKEKGNSKPLTIFGIKNFLLWEWKEKLRIFSKRAGKLHC